MGQAVNLTIFCISASSFAVQSRGNIQIDSNISKTDPTGDDRQPETNDKAAYWWLALNGASCAASTFPLNVDLNVSPVPQQLLGFFDRKEQLEIQQLLLNAPMTEVDTFMTKVLPKKIKRGEVIYIRPPNPEPASRGPTMWLQEPRSTSHIAQPALLREGTSRCKPFPK